jgi:hypothetical protein
VGVQRVCFIPPASCFSVILRAGRVFSLALPSPSPVARLPGCFRDDTLCNVNYCRRNELEQVFQDAGAPRRVSVSYLSLSLSRSVHGRHGLSSSFSLVSSSSSGSTGSVKEPPLPLLFSGWIPRESSHHRARFRGADLVKRLVRGALASRPALLARLAARSSARREAGSLKIAISGIVPARAMRRAATIDRFPGLSFPSLRVQGQFRSSFVYRLC